MICFHLAMKAPLSSGSNEFSSGINECLWGGIPKCNENGVTKPGSVPISLQICLTLGCSASVKGRLLICWITLKYISNGFSLLKVSWNNLRVSLNSLWTLSVLLALELWLVIVVTWRTPFVLRKCSTSGLRHIAVALSDTIFKGALNIANVRLRQLITVFEVWSWTRCEIKKLLYKSIMFKQAAIFRPLKVCPSLKTIKSNCQHWLLEVGNGILPSGTTFLFVVLINRHERHPVQTNLTSPWVDPSTHL